VLISNLSQRQFAKKHGMYESWLSGYLSGTRIINNNKLELIALREELSITLDFSINKIEKIDW
jgi:transcriptional regulator with XRE-family HTH domain